MLIHRIERYLQQHRIPPARFGREAVGDPSFVSRLKAGRQSRAATVARVEAYLNQERQAPKSRDRG
jgi:2,4-dienoyl-CoA reductase-like NADH-dependent reductase (Old Yellow Enzyme family)